MSERDYRKIGLEAHGDKCAVCGDDEDVIHHRDGDNSNNEVSNLIPLCDSCHQKVHAGKAINETAAELVAELGKPVRADGGNTSIQISEGLADELYNRKGRSESYEDVIWRLLEREHE
jgi:CRISPR/Cas system-associated protein Cas10 (large subunit of type III CRISPR-Cas system)